VKDWTLHDLRRTFRTTMARLGVAPHIAERLVNHLSSRSDMEQVYDRYRYLPEMRAAMQAHENFIAQLVGVSAVTQRKTPETLRFLRGAIILQPRLYQQAHALA